MRKRELILAMRRHEKVREYHPLSKTYGEECLVKRVSYFVRESGKISIGAELWGYNSVYHVLAKNVYPAREVTGNEA
ncbi:MAG: hypothetical protein IKY33_01525 [Clostridia bacterium]|nr:hypothetical protein [Clostridia bacterium]